jgi:uncharacterized protein (TIGR03435 family)
VKAAIFGVCLLVAGQAAQRSDPVVFEVASIRPNTNRSAGTSSRIAGGRYTATRVSLETLILTAFGLQRHQLIGAPRWLVTERFDIVATATGELTTNGAEPTLPAALRGLLKERFKLVERSEVRQFDVYALKRSRDDGRLGPGLSPSTVDCAVVRCVVSAPGQAGRYFRPSAPMSSLVAALRMNVDRPVIDHTGLQGRFSIELNWAPLTLPSLAALAADRPGQPLPSREGPSIFTAVQEQLGLKLEPTVATLDVVVIESVERPTND